MKKKNSNKHEIIIDKNTFYDKKTHKIVQLDNKVIKTKKGFKNKNGLFDVCFNNSKDDNNTIVLEKDNYKIEMKLLGKKDGNHHQLKNKTFFKENDYKIICKDVFEDEDIDFEIINNKILKENIIIRNNNKSSYKYEYLFKMKNLKLKNDGSNLSFVNENNEVIFEILPPVMIDSVGSKSNKISYTINTQNSNTFTLIIDADSNWINSTERNLPIFLDPSITFYNEDNDGAIFESNFGTLEYSDNDNTENTCTSHHSTSKYKATITIKYYLLNYLCPNITNIYINIKTPNNDSYKLLAVKEHYVNNGVCNLINLKVETYEDNSKYLYQANVTNSLLIRTSTYYEVEFDSDSNFDNQNVIISLKINYRDTPGETKELQFDDNLKYLYDYSLKTKSFLLNIPNNRFNLSAKMSLNSYYDENNDKILFSSIQTNYDCFIEQKGDNYYYYDINGYKIINKFTVDEYYTKDENNDNNVEDIEVVSHFKYCYLGDKNNILEFACNIKGKYIVIENKKYKYTFLSLANSNIYYLHAIVDKTTNKLTLINRVISGESNILTAIYLIEYNEYFETNNMTDETNAEYTIHDSIYFQHDNLNKINRIYRKENNCEINLFSVGYSEALDNNNIHYRVESINIYDSSTLFTEINKYEFNYLCESNNPYLTVSCLNKTFFKVLDDGKLIEFKNNYETISNSTVIENNNTEFSTLMKIEYASTYHLYITDKYGNKESLLLDFEGNSVNSFVYKNNSQDNNIKTYDEVNYYYNVKNSNLSVKEVVQNSCVTGKVNIKKNNEILNLNNVTNLENLGEFICDDINFNNQPVFMLSPKDTLTFNLNLSGFKNLDNSNYLLCLFIKKKYDDFLEISLNDYNFYDLTEAETDEWHFLVCNKPIKLKDLQSNSVSININFDSRFEDNLAYIAYPIIKKMENEKITKYIRTIEKKELAENPPDDKYKYKITFTYKLIQNGKEDILTSFDVNNNVISTECSSDFEKKTTYTYKTFEKNLIPNLPNESNGDNSASSENETYTATLFELETETTTTTDTNNYKVCSGIIKTYNKTTSTDTINYKEKERISSDLLENNIINITESVSYNNSIDKLSNTIINNNSNKSISTSKSLDAFKNVLTKANELGEIYVTNTYNHLNNIKSMSLLNLATKSYSYNNLLLTEINAFENENTSINNTFEYTEGLLTKVSFNNNINYLYSYDKNKCLSKFEMKINNNLISSQNFNYKDDCVYNDDTIVDNYNYFEISYGNYKAKEIYDENDNVILFKEKKDENSSYEISKEYVYNECNNLVETTEKIGNNFLTTAYLYENDDNVISKIMHAGVFSYNISYQEYDKTNFTQKTTYSFDNGNKTNEYIYEYSRFDGSVCAVTNPLGNFSIKRDGYLRRKLFTTTVSNDISVTKTFNYHSTDTQDTNIINSVSHKTNFSGGSATLCNESYEYDAKGNITKQVLFGKPIYYTYDKFNRLVREDNKLLDVSKFYRYDNNNNVTLTGTGEYTHDDGDMYATDLKYFTYNTYNQLIKAENTDGTYIEFGTNYDENGNPLLVSKNEVCVSGSEVQTQYSNLIFSRYNTLIAYGNINFEYDCNGNRVSKKYGNITHLYYINNNTIHREDIIDAALDEVVSIYYYYDLNGLCGFEYNNNKYYYIKDLTGNIIGIYNSNGGLVARYAYDAWGNHKVLNANGTENNNDTFIGNINPFRYKGYYYDVETQLFYCNSRYYSPELCRFIQPDSIEYLNPENINGLNLYVYCMNNPIMYADPSGNFPVLACILAATALVGLGLTIGGVASDNNTLTAIGLGITGGSALGAGGLAISVALATGAIATGVVGGVTAVAGLGSLGFMSAEIQEATGNGNWIMDSTGMSEGLYNGLLLGTASIATLGSIASFGMLATNPMTGFTHHGLEQALFRDGHGVSRKAILNAVKHPLDVVNQGAKGIKYVGKLATVVLNSTGKVITTWAKTSAGWRNIIILCFILGLLNNNKNY